MTDMKEFAGVHGYYFDAVAEIHDFKLRAPSPLLGQGFQMMVEALKDSTDEALKVLADLEHVAFTQKDKAFVAASRALCLSVHRQIDEALAASTQAVEHEPDNPSYLEIHASVLVHARRLKDAEEALERTVSLDPMRGRAWASLAVLRGLAGRWEEAAQPVERARALGGEFGANLVRLCYIFSRLMTGRDPAPEFSVGAARQRQGADMMELLPQVGGTFASPGPAGAPIVFVACDPLYLKEHVPALAWSLESQGEPVTLHIHVYNPGNEIDTVMPMVDAGLTCVTLNVTAERVDNSALKSGPTYFSSARFCRAWQLLQANESPVIVVDADALFRKPAGAFPGIAEGGHDVVLTEAKSAPPWDRYLAGATAYLPTDDARAFLGTVAAIVAENLLTKRARWFIDQMAIFTAAEIITGDARILRVPTGQSCSITHEPDAAVWAITVDKVTDNAFHGLRRELLDRYGDPGAVCRLQENPTEVLDGTHGRFIVNRHDPALPAALREGGSWRQDELELLNRLLRPGDVAMDVGAGYGHHAVALSQMVGETGSVYAFEAQRLVWQCLAGTLALNWVRNAQCLNLAVGATGGLTLPVPPIHYGTDGATSSPGALDPSAPANPAWLTADDIPMVALDDLGVQACRLIRVGGRRSASAVLAGAGRLIDHLRPIIQGEIDPEDDDAVGFLAERGYALFVQDFGEGDAFLALPPGEDAPTDLPGLRLKAVEPKGARRSTR